MEKPVIVFDNGSGYLKAGLSDQDIPRCTIPALVGRTMLRSAEKIGRLELKSLMIGDEVTKVRSLLELSYPMEEGIIKNKEDMELLWDYVLTKKLNIMSQALNSYKYENEINFSINDVKAAKDIGLKTIAITGENESELSRLATICIKAPASETYKVQEYHLPIYHYICIELEKRI